ncbi:glucuronate isomerase [Aestuariimicrobium sp. T2.26MG-19.2B]|uniref:glucuronate isomerase n=1 Tax=Aestuariimicrobium sp. T2.26MG-19.2B TaxID=3040679 RepID=UPI0024776BFF|nr:glucuronate isomerase [Aestuariimicrobium sp. T2.26MG-19.2B]CAI9407747.1 Uronate isomerase [Aestuariimicrobium sp. T2.26MG-19.2B]
MVSLTLHPDRLFPAEPSTRDVARRLYAQVKDLPIISPHGHVPPAWIADDIPFRDPASLLITPDHYVNRMLHANGVELSTLGVNQGELDETAARTAFRALCEHWNDFRGTPVKYWLEDALVGIFGVDVVPSAQTADQIYDTVAAWIAQDSSRPRALMGAFDITFMATTDDPCDDLVHHRKLADDASFTRRVVPTFRPDKYLEPFRDDWNELTDRLAEVSGVDISSYSGWVAAMENRRAYFKANGAVSTDHSHPDLGTIVLEPSEAERLFRLARAGRISEDEATVLRRNMLTEQARMATEDGLTMTLHPGVARNHHRPTFETYGADVGCDIPIAVEATRSLQPLLNAYGTSKNLNLVLFTLDETMFSREFAPLAGFYPSVYVGVPWWFIDAPDAIRRFRKATTETAGFSRTSGFIDDTRAFCSIPARHDMSRRLDCGHLAELVVEHRLTEDDAHEVAHQLVVDQPTRVFKL